jgi:hypothetical protein
VLGSLLRPRQGTAVRAEPGRHWQVGRALLARRELDAFLGAGAAVVGEEEGADEGGDSDEESRAEAPSAFHGPEPDDFW